MFEHVCRKIQKPRAWETLHKKLAYIRLSKFSEAISRKKDE